MSGGHSSEPQTAAPPGAKPAPIDPLIGQTIEGRYVVETMLGEGGMGVVYRARHRLIERKVALKVLRAEFAKDREILERFVQEAKTATSIGNDHIVDILDFGQLEDGSTFFAMEYLEGISLTEAISQKLAPPRIATIGIQICDGLGAAHHAGIVHRDLKPDNIFLLNRAGGDFVKILDFGIAKVSRDAKQKLTRAGAVFGTPHYMSPEQAAGTSVDHRADIYALGVILYEMAAGRLPFDSDDLMGILTQHMYRAPVPIRALVNNTDCPPALEAIVQKCLEKRPGQRYQTVDELAADLKRFLDGQVPLAVAELMGRSNHYNVPVDYFRQPGTGPFLPATPGKAAGRSSGGGRLVVVAAALLFVAALIAGGAALWVKSQQRQPTAALQAATASEPADPPEPPSPAVTVASVATAAPQTIQVELKSTVRGAVAMIDGSAKPLPTTVEVSRGSTRTVTVKAEGHDASDVPIDGSKSSIDVPLKRAQRATGPAGTQTTATAKAPEPVKSATTATATKPVDPWDGPVKIFEQNKNKK